jgi:hypothetical protein
MGFIVAMACVNTSPSPRAQKIYCLERNELADSFDNRFEGRLDGSSARFKALDLARPEVDFDPPDSPRSPDNRRNTNRNIADSITGSILHGAYRQDPVLVQGNRVDHISNGDTDGKTSSALLRNAFRT